MYSLKNKILILILLIILIILILKNQIKQLPTIIKIIIVM